MAFITTTDEHIASGGTITGDITIKGDLTVNGDGSGNYDEIVDGNIEISDTLRLNPTISSGSATTLAFMRSGTNKWRFIQPSDDSYLKLYNDQATATQMYFKSDNTIGIGTDAPDQTLHIHKASAGSIASDSNTVLTVENSDHSLISILSPEAKDGAVMFGNPTDGALDGRLVYDNADRALQFWTAGTQRFTIDENGDVAITNSGSGKPKLTLHNSNTSGSQSGVLAFEQGSTSQSDDQQLGYISFGGYRDNDSSIETMVSMAAFMSDITTADCAGEFRLQVQIDNSASNVLNINGFDGGVGQGTIVFNEDSKDFDFRVESDNNANAFFIEGSTGNIGIGTTSPDYPLHIHGASDGVGYVKISDSNTGEGATDGARIGFNSGVMRIQNFENSDMEFYVNNTTKSLTLKSDGNVGIGTDSPDKLLHLKSSGSESPCIKIENNNDDQYPPRIQFVKDVGSGAEADYDQLGQLQFRGQDTNGNLGTFTRIIGKSLDVTDSTEDGQLVIDVMKNNDADGVQVFIDPVGFDVYGTPLKVFGANTGHETSALCMGQDTSALSQIRAYGADDSTAGTLEFRMTSSAGAVNKGVMKLDVNSRISLSNNDSGTQNTVFGYNAGDSLDSGSNYNVFIGHNVAGGGTLNDATENTAVGYSALANLTSGDTNTAIGRSALLSLNSGSRNTAIGFDAGKAITTANRNIAIGYEALYTEDADGDRTTAVGYTALYSQNGTTEAMANTGIGYASGYYNVTGTNNTYLGYQAGTGASGNSNSNNVGVGKDALLVVTTGSYNAVLGQGAGKAVTDGHNNVAIGNQALMTSTSVGICVAIGDDAMKNGNVTADADGTVAVGGSSLYALTEGQYNTAVGYRSLNANQTGDGCTALGHDSLLLSTGNDNTAMGRNSLASNTSGASNTGLGIWAGFGNATGSGNTYVGSSAGRGTANQNNNENVAVGYDAMLNVTTGSYNTAVGYRALDASTTGEKNTAIGNGSLGGIVGGYNNTALGWNAGLSLTTGVGNVALGLRALDAAAHGESSNIAIGADALGAAKENVPSSGSNAHTLDDNIAIGDNAMLGGDLGTGTGVLNFKRNIAIGGTAMASTGSNQQTGIIAIGYGALNALTSGDSNTAIGYSAQLLNQSGSGNTSVGYEALKGGSGNGSYNTAIGKSSLTANTSGSSNTALGNNALVANTSGASNVAIGGYTDSNYPAPMWTNQTGSQCIAIGSGALKTANEDDNDGSVAVGYGALRLVACTGGGQYTGMNTGVGHRAAGSVATGVSNTSVGFETFVNAAGATSYNTGLGTRAGYRLGDDGASDHSSQNTLLGYLAMGGGHSTVANNTAHANVAIGYRAGGGLTGTSTSLTSTNLVAIGHDAMNAVSTGSSNVAIGKDSGQAITTGAFNTCIGTSAEVSASSAENQIVIGYGTTGVANNSVTLGNASVTNNYLREKIELKARNDQPAILELQADNADNNADIWQIEAGTDGMFQIKHKDTGSLADALTIGGSTGQVTIAGHGTAAHNGTSMLLVQDTGVKTGGDFTIGKFVATINDGDADLNDTFIGLNSQMVFNDTGESFGGLYGVSIHCESTETADEESTALVGIDVKAAMNGTHSDCQNMYGMYINVDQNSGVTDAGTFGTYTIVDIESAANNLGHVYGHVLEIDSDDDPNGGAGSVIGNYNVLYSNADWFEIDYDGDNSTQRFRISAAGQVDAEGTINASQSLDYAEYFESKDGKDIAVGTTVKLDGNKIVACSDGDTPLGVIRPKSGHQIVGGGQLFHWESKYIKDDYGAEVWEDSKRVTWEEEITAEEYSKRGKDDTGGVHGGRVKDSVEEPIYYQETDTIPDGKKAGDLKTARKYIRKHKYHKDILPAGVKVPKDAVEFDTKRQKLNPDYDASKSYKSREERDEWHVVGLLGQIPVTKGQPTGSWIKMKDVSDTVEMYFVK